MRTLWKGTLATGGRKAEEFEAEIVESDNEPAQIIRRNGLAVTIVHPPMIRGEYFVKAIADLARGRLPS